MKTYVLTKRLLPALFIALVILSIPSCKKYEDGPAMSVYSKKHRLKNMWIMEKVLVNGEDKTAEYLGNDDGFYIDLESKDRFYWYFTNYSNANGLGEVLHGSCSFWEGKEGFTLSSLLVHPSRFCTGYEITRLTNKELWAKSGDINFPGFEFRFVARK